MLSKCVNCDFYVRENDEFCLNCGLEKPTQEVVYPSVKSFQLLRLIKSKLLRLLSFTCLFFILLFAAADWDSSNIAFLKDYVIFFVFTFSAISVFTIFYLLEKWILRKINNKRGKRKENFLSRKQIIENRIFDLDKRVKTIDKSLDQIKNNSQNKLKEIHPEILSAREIIINHIARYELQKQRINLLQIQNNVSPFLFDFHKLTGQQNENGLNAIEDAKTAINRIRQNLTRYDAIDFPSPVLPEKDAFLRQLSETEMNCEKLRDVLLSREVTIALRDISPVEEAIKIPASEELIRETELFNIQTNITDFTESFDALENEYRRLKYENEIFET